MSPETPIALRTPSGALFAKLSGADEARFTTENGPTFEVAVLGLRLRTAPQGGDFPFYARRTLSIGGLVRPGGETRLGWVEGAPRSTLDLRLADDPRLEWIGAAPQTAIECADLALTPQTLAEAPVAYFVLDGAQPIPIAATAGGTPIARLRPTPGAGDAHVAVTVLDGTQARIDWRLEDGPLEDARVIGWIDRARVRSALVGGGAGRGVGGLGMASTSDWTGCAKPHPLYVLGANGVEPIGTVSAGTRVRSLGALPPWIAVEVVGPSMRVNPPPIVAVAGATFVMREADANDCH